MAHPEVRPVPHDEWAPLPRQDVVGVDGRVLVAKESLTVAMLRFAPHSTIDEHAAEHVVEVICLEGSGFTSVDGATAPIRAGEAVSWPVGSPHRLWTEGTAMVTLMVEHPAPYRV